MRNRVAFALTLTAGFVGALSASACAQSLGTTQKGRTVADSSNPLALLHPGQIESVSVQRVWFSGASVREEGDVIALTTGGPTSGPRWGRSCRLERPAAEAVIAALASAQPGNSAGGNMPADIQVRIRSSDGLETVAILPPRSTAQPDGSFEVAIAVGSEGRFYRLGDDGLAAIESIADAAGCAAHQS